MYRIGFTYFVRTGTGCEDFELFLVNRLSESYAYGFYLSGKLTDPDLEYAVPFSDFIV